MQIKTKIVSSHTAESKPVKQEVNSTMILPPLVFPACTVDLLFDWFGISCTTTDNFCFYLQNRHPKPVKQEVNSTVILPPFSIPCLNTRNQPPRLFCRSVNDEEGTSLATLAAKLTKPKPNPKPRNKKKNRITFGRFPFGAGRLGSAVAGHLSGTRQLSV